MMEKKSSAQIETTKEGTAIDPTEITPVNLSRKVLRRTAEKQPSGMPTSAAQPIAVSARITVKRIWSSTVRVTERSVNTSRPRSPWSAFHMKRPYCTMKGSFRPRRSAYLA